MTNIENPAERLLLLIENGKKQPGGTVCKKVWAHLLNVPEDDEPVIYNRIGKTISLIDEASNRLSSLDNLKSDRFLKWVPAVRKAFSVQNLNGNWASFIGQIDQHSMDYLSNTADILSARISNTPYDIDKIEEIASSISEVIDDILSSDIPESIKSFMVKKLRKVQQAIDEYQITGGEPVKESIESVFGHLILNKEFREFTTEKSSVSTKFWMIIGNLVLLTTLTTNGFQLEKETRKLLPSPVIEIIESSNNTEETKGEIIEDAEFKEIKT